MITSTLRWWQRPSRTNRMRWTTWHGPSCTEGWPRTRTTTTFKVTTAERTYMYKLALMLHMAWKVLANLPQVCKHGRYNILCLRAISLDMGSHYHSYRPTMKSMNVNYRNMICCLLYRIKPLMMYFPICCRCDTQTSVGPPVWAGREHGVRSGTVQGLSTSSCSFGKLVSF